MPIPGSPPTRTSEPGHEPAAEDAVELVDPESAARQVGFGDRPRGRRVPTAPPTAPRTAARSARDGSRTTRLDEGVPAVAGAALAFPAEERFPARLADEAALGPRHR